MMTYETEKNTEKHPKEYPEEKMEGVEGLNGKIIGTSETERYRNLTEGLGKGSEKCPLTSTPLLRE